MASPSWGPKLAAENDVKIGNHRFVSAGPAGPNGAAATTSASSGQIGDAAALAASNRLTTGDGTDADRALLSTYRQQQNTVPASRTASADAPAPNAQPVFSPTLPPGITPDMVSAPVGQPSPFGSMPSSMGAAPTGPDASALAAALRGQAGGSGPFNEGVGTLHLPHRAFLRRCVLSFHLPGLLDKRGNAAQRTALCRCSIRRTIEGDRSARRPGRSLPTTRRHQLDFWLSAVRIWRNPHRHIDPADLHGVDGRARAARQRDRRAVAGVQRRPGAEDRLIVGRHRHGRYGPVGTHELFAGRHLHRSTTARNVSGAAKAVGGTVGTIGLLPEAGLGAGAGSLAQRVGTAALEDDAPIACEISRVVDALDRLVRLAP